MKKVLILSTGVTTEALEAVETLLQKMNTFAPSEYRCVRFHYNDATILLDGDGDVVFPDSTKLSDYDLLYIKSFITCSELALAIVQLALHMKILLIGTELKNAPSSSKITEYVRLYINTIPIPKTIISGRLQSHHFELLRTELQLPFICKDAMGKKGMYNFLVKSQADFDEIIANYPDMIFINQEFIENSGDYRVIVFDNDPRLVIYRSRGQNESHLNNTSQGAIASLVAVAESESKLLRLAQQSASVLQRDIAGVDVMWDEKLDRYIVLEVNTDPQLASGSFVNEKMQELSSFMLEKVNQI